MTTFKSRGGKERGREGGREGGKKRGRWGEEGGGGMEEVDLDYSALLLVNLIG